MSGRVDNSGSQDGVTEQMNEQVIQACNGWLLRMKDGPS